MQLVAEIDGGWTECDNCGNGQTPVEIYLEGPNLLFTYSRSSRCYRDVHLTHLTHEALLEQMEADRQLIHTRRARRSWKNFMRRVADRQVFWKRDRQLAPVTAPRIVSYDPGPTVASGNQYHQWAEAAAGMGVAAQSAAASMNMMARNYTIHVMPNTINPSQITMQMLDETAIASPTWAFLSDEDIF